MPKEIKMPQLSQTTDEITLIKWLIEEGQEVKRGQALCEVETDKSNMELESFENGTVLRIIAVPGQVVLSGQTIAIIGEKNEKISESRCSGKDSNTDKQDLTGHPSVGYQEKIPAESGEFFKNSGSDGQKTFMNQEFKATSIVRNIAKIRNIDLRTIKGTGPQGMITKADLARFLEEKSMAEASDGHALSKSQSAVARNLTASKSQIPHYYIKTSICADMILNWRENNRIPANSSSDSKTGDITKVSIYAILVFAAAAALKKYPRLNGYFRDNKIILRDKINIGFAVGQDEELFVPVIKNAITKSIFEIDKEIKSLIAKAGSQRFNEGDLSEGTFTVSNLGMYDVDEFYAIINPPQAGILAAGKIKKMLYVDELEKVNIRNEFTVTGSFDHRIVNGKSSAQFMQEFKKTIEERIK